MTFGFNNSIAWLPVIALAWFAWFPLVWLPCKFRELWGAEK